MLAYLLCVSSGEPTLIQAEAHVKVTMHAELQPCHKSLERILKMLKLMCPFPGYFRLADYNVNAKDITSDNA